MIKGKMKFPSTYEGHLCWTEGDYMYHKRKKEEQNRRLAVLAEMEILTADVNRILKEKEEYNKVLNYHIDKEVINVKNQIDDYTNQINRLSLALDLCKKSLRTSRLIKSNDYKKENPFPLAAELKKLYNKIHKLNNKL